MTRLSLLLAASCLLSLAAPGQRGGEEAGETPDVSEKLEMLERGKRREKEQAEMLANMTPEERLEHGTRRGSRNYCRFVAACRPPKLMPGQTGTLMISAILQGSAVLPAPAQVTLVPLPNDPAVSVGELYVRPASRGNLAEAYQGRPVYENTAIMELPVTLAPTVKIGEKQLIAVDLKFDIFDGSSGQPIGRFIERVSTSIDVGAHVEPNVAGREAKVEQVPAAGDRSATGPKSADGSAEAPLGSEGGSNAMGGQAADVGSEAAAPVESAGKDAQPAEVASKVAPLADSSSDGPPTMLLIGGGVILGLIVLMVLRRK